MTTLITGGTGALGKELKKYFPNCLAPTHQEFDIVNKNLITKFIKINDIDTIVHTAALTKVVLCEENKQLAWDTNVIGTRNLIRAVQNTEKDIYFIYISTACVFDGLSGMYNELSIPNPKNFYALTKLIGEHEVNRLTNYLIVRTNFVAREKWPYPKAFIDRYGTYLFSEGVAIGISDVSRARLSGVVHIVGDKRLSMFELAKLTTPNIQPMSIDEYSGPELTIDMSLDTIKWKKYSITSL